MISYSIKAAQEAGLFDRILVTTDSDAIAEVALAHGAEVPFRRPPELCDDNTPTAPVVAHAIEWLRQAGTPADYACCIYATAPFIRAEDIRVGFDILTKNAVSSAFTVTTFAFPIFRALRLAENGALAMFWPEHKVTRSQDLPTAYHDAGQFYWLSVTRFLESKTLYDLDTRPIVLPRYLVQDIDTLEDWEMAEHMYQALSLRKSRETI